MNVGDTIRVDGTAVEVADVIEYRYGTVTDGNGYVHPTGDWSAWIVRGIDGKTYAGAENNGDVYECEQWDNQLAAYLHMWDSDFVGDFEAEGLLEAEGEQA